MDQLVPRVAQVLVLVLVLVLLEGTALVEMPEAHLQKRLA